MATSQRLIRVSFETTCKDMDIYKHVKDGEVWFEIVHDEDEDFQHETFSTVSDCMKRIHDHLESILT